MNNGFKAGELVRVNALRCLAYGRYGRVLMTSSRGDQVQIRFADLPMSEPPPTNPVCLVQCFSRNDLTLVEDVPVAAFYLVVIVLTLVGTQEHKRHAIAHGQTGQNPYDLAETVAAKFFGSLGDSDGEFYLWENTPYAAKLLSYEQITVAQYVELRRAVPDYDLGADVPGIPF